jgi:hypothetical protein
MISTILMLITFIIGGSVVTCIIKTLIALTYISITGKDCIELNPKDS